VKIMCGEALNHGQHSGGFDPLEEDARKGGHRSDDSGEDGVGDALGIAEIRACGQRLSCCPRMLI
jgi:hypothetical protein